MCKIVKRYVVVAILLVGFAELPNAARGVEVVTGIHGTFLHQTNRRFSNG